MSLRQPHSSGSWRLISNITSLAQLSGEADTWLAIRSTLSKLVNSGTVWGGVLILAGWLVRRPTHAALAGAIAGLVALSVHYGLGLLLDAIGPDSWVDVYGPSVWCGNWLWFAAALVLGPPLGVLGAAARRRDLWGLAARLVVPVAAVVEPLALGMLTRSDAPSIAAGIVLRVAGLLGVAIVLLRRRRRSDDEGA